MFSLMTCIQKYICKPRGRFYTTFVDFSKAFDSVIHSHLWASVINNGIHGKMLKMLRAMYQNMKACIKTNKGLTEYFECEIGTRQGDVLSPLLFILHLNEFLKQLKEKEVQGIYISEEQPSLSALLYADDLSQLADTPGRLQILMDELKMYCDEWGLSVNIEKLNGILTVRH